MLQPLIFSSFQVRFSGSISTNSNIPIHINDINYILFELHKLYPNVKDSDLFDSLHKWILLFGWKQTDSNDFRLFFFAQSLGSNRENTDLIGLVQKRFSNISLWAHAAIRSFPFVLSQFSNKVFFVTELCLIPTKVSQVL